MTREQKLKIIDLIFDVDPREIKEFIYVDGSKKQVERFLNNAKDELIARLEELPMID